jgi:hypothetical protein
MQFSHASCNFFPLRPQYSPQDRSQISSVYFIPLVWETKFDTHTGIKEDSQYFYYGCDPESCLCPFGFHFCTFCLWESKNLTKGRIVNNVGKSSQPS